MNAITWSPRAIVNDWIGRAVIAVRLNAVFQQHVCNKPVLVKFRNAFGKHILPVANLFFGAMKTPSRFFTDATRWQDHEIATFQMLNPGYSIRKIGHTGVCADQLPGESLWTHLKRGTLTWQMLRAAAREFRRAHSMHSDYFLGRFSHGDGAMCNVLYDAEARRARLIDFELVHRPSMPAAQRQADDLFAFLADLASGINEERWLTWAVGFLRAYGDATVLEELCNRLEAPRGLYMFWWKVRTNFARRSIVLPRLLDLRDAICRDLLSAKSPRRAEAKGAYPLDAAIPSIATP